MIGQNLISQLILPLLISFSLPISFYLIPLIASCCPNYGILKIASVRMSQLHQHRDEQIVGRMVLSLLVCGVLMVLQGIFWRYWLPLPEGDDASNLTTTGNHASTAAEMTPSFTFMQGFLPSMTSQATTGSGIIHNCILSMVPPFGTIFKTLLLNTILFAVPLYEFYGIYVHSPSSGYSKTGSKLLEDLMEPLLIWLPNSVLRILKIPGAAPLSMQERFVVLRNIWVGPLIEEVIYRCILINTLYLWPRRHLLWNLWMTGGQSSVTDLGASDFFFSRGMAILVASLLFGISHLHHIWQRVVYDGLPVQIAVQQSVLQLSFTTVFGLYNGWVYVKTNSLWACFLLHSYCNWIGLPNFVRIVQHPRFGRHMLGALLVSVVAFFSFFSILLGGDAEKNHNPFYLLDAVEAG